MTLTPFGQTVMVEEQHLPHVTTGPMSSQPPKVSGAKIDLVTVSAGDTPFTLLCNVQAHPAPLVR